MIDKKDIQLVITAVGIGKRFLDAGYNTHKCLLEVDGRPIIKQIIDMFPGIEDITFITNIQDRHKNNMNIILRQIAPKSCHTSIPIHKNGPVWSVAKIFDYINNDKPVIIAYCDCISYFNFDKWLESIGDFDGSLLANKGFHPQMLGSDNYAVCYNKDNILTEIREKEPLKDRFSEYVSTGVHYFKTGKLLKECFAKLIEENININGEYYVSLVFNYLKNRANIFEVENVVNLGTPLDYEEYKQISDYFWNHNKFRIGSYEHFCDTTLVMPIAGKGERFKPEYIEPKPLIKVDGLPMFVKSINSTPACDKKIFIVLREHVNNNLIHKKILDCYPNAKILILEKLTQGQAETIYMGIKDLNPERPILISACDFSISYDESEYINLFKEQSNDIIAFSFKNVQAIRLNPQNYAWMEVDENNYLKKLYCKQFPFDNPSKRHVFMGTVFFRKAKYFLDAYRYNIDNNIKTNGEFYLDDLLNTCVNNNLKVKVFQANHYNCWGSIQDLKVYNYWRDYFRKKFNI